MTTKRKGVPRPRPPNGLEVNSGARFGPQQIALVISLTEQRVPPAAIALRLGRSVPSIYMLLQRIKRQKLNASNPGKRASKVSRAERMVWLFEHGVTPTEIGRVFNISRANVFSQLSYRGLDADERALVLEELPEVAKVSQGCMSLAVAA